MSIIKNTEELNNLLDAVQKLPVKKDEQEKVVNITENSTTVVTPDEGMTLSEVTVNVAVEEKSLEQILEQYPSNILISPQVDFSGGLTYAGCWGAIGIDFLNLENIDSGHFSYTGFDIIRFRKLQEIKGIPFDGAVLTQCIFESLCSIEDSQAVDSLTSAEIFVPRNLVDPFKADTNWSAVASSIVSIEDNLERLSQYFPDLVDKYGGNK